MDSTLKQMLDSFRFSLDNSAAVLGQGNEKLIRARELMSKIDSMAEQGADIAAVSMDPAFAELGALIGELAAMPPAPVREAGSDDGIPSSGTSGAPAEHDGIPPASVPAAGYHMAWDSMDQAGRRSQEAYYRRIFEIEEEAENAIHFNTLLTEDGVLLEMSRKPLMDAARETLEQSEDAHSPTVRYQQNLTLSTYRDVGTVTELEFQGTRLAEFSNVEHSWDAMYLDVIGLLPACAQAIESFGPSDENVAKLRNSHGFMADFMGITWDDVFTDPRYLLFWEMVLWPRVPGEKREKYGVHTAQGWRDLLKEKFYDPFVVEEQPVVSDPSRARVVFWRGEHASSEVLELLGNPPRPAVSTEG